MTTALHRIAKILGRNREPANPSRMGRGPQGVSSGAILAQGLRTLRSWSRNGR
ncbi:hypothetical protein [Streptomyces meridianus]|uniref:Uncharacterized protein n=1 Tax=Streptomyces meridianus TaxID=2938945 RepID=A0ABT0X5M8_9ACTN|nr:hypothetical protein [Streptomyces meridianus]MCM2577084.1 hypothetical protein [Streptomyces meridianus]